jgi:hypothetical protein
VNNDKVSTRPRKFDNFYEEYQDNEVRVVLHNEKIINGKIVESRRYWIKVEANNIVYYINKAYIMFIQPLKVVRR